MDDERAGEGVEHLQVAARELIAAARAFLDVAEDVVRDPKVAEGLLVGLGDLADTARTAAREAAKRATEGGGGGDPGAEDDEDGGVQHIHVS
jgi:hypothetical protein